MNHARCSDCGEIFFYDGEKVPKFCLRCTACPTRLRIIPRPGHHRQKRGSSVGVPETAFAINYTKKTT